MELENISGFRVGFGWPKITGLPIGFLGFGSPRASDVVGEQKSGSGRVRGLLFGVGSGIKISGTSPSGFGDFGGF